MGYVCSVELSVAINVTTVKGVKGQVKTQSSKVKAIT